LRGGKRNWGGEWKTAGGERDVESLRRVGIVVMSEREMGGGGEVQGTCDADAAIGSAVCVWGR
jgi:hypothetical protein